MYHPIFEVYFFVFKEVFQKIMSLCMLYIQERFELNNIHQNLSVKFWNCFHSLLGGFDLNKASNWPLRGIKHTLWEGGVRGSAFIWSPLLETSSEVQKCGIMGIQDWLPTLYAAAGMIPFVIFKHSKKKHFWELQFENVFVHWLPKSKFLD